MFCGSLWTVVAVLVVATVLLQNDVCADDKDAWDLDDNAMQDLLRECGPALIKRLEDEMTKVTGCNFVMKFCNIRQKGDAIGSVLGGLGALFKCSKAEKSDGNQVGDELSSKMASVCTANSKAAISELLIDRLCRSPQPTGISAVRDSTVAKDKFLEAVKTALAIQAVSPNKAVLETLAEFIATTLNAQAIFANCKFVTAVCDSSKSTTVPKAIFQGHTCSKKTAMTGTLLDIIFTDKVVKVKTTVEQWEVLAVRIMLEFHKDHPELRLLKVIKAADGMSCHKDVKGKEFKSKDALMEALKKAAADIVV